MSECIELKLFRLRAEVLESAMESKADLGDDTKREFVQLMKDMRETWLALCDKTPLGLNQCEKVILK